jgi:hypothetical protein
MAGASNNKAYLFTRDGQIRWEYLTQSPVMYVYTSVDGEFSYALEFLNNTLHQISERGGELSVKSYSQRITDVSITDDGRFVAIGFANAYLYFTDKNGNVQWKQAMSAPVETVKMTADGSLVFAVTSDKEVWILNKNGNILLHKKFDGVPNAIATTLEGDYFVACGLDTVYFFAITRYLEYIVREQAKMVKMMKEGDMREKGVIDKDGRRVATYPGAPDHPVNTCRLCGTTILEGRTLCNYCEMMQRRPPR